VGVVDGEGAAAGAAVEGGVAEGVGVVVCKNILIMVGIL